MNDIEIVEVWQENMQEEIVKISYLSEKYNIIAFDTEFPGTVKFIQKLTDDEDDYHMVKENVNSLKLIQIGFCLCNDKGEVPEKGLIWQFNFKYDLRNETYHPDAIAMLKDCGIDFDKLAKDGCDHMQFAEFILSSGIVLNEDIKWICFHGSYDFAYFLKMMMNQELSDQNSDFLSQMQTYFPQFHDIKFLINDIETIRSLGLGNLASELKVSNKGPQHQAGGDSLTTLLVYLKLLEDHLKNSL